MQPAVPHHVVADPHLTELCSTLHPIQRLCPETHGTVCRVTGRCHTPSLHDCPRRQVLPVSHPRRENRARAAEPGLKPSPHPWGPKCGQVSPTLGRVHTQGLTGAISPQLLSLTAPCSTRSTGSGVASQNLLSGRVLVLQGSACSDPTPGGPPQPPAITAAVGVSLGSPGPMAQAGALCVSPSPHSRQTGPAPRPGSEKGECGQQVAAWVPV